MIISTGIDIVEIERINSLYLRYGEKFLRKILHPSELEQLPRGNLIFFLAGRWAVKEAFWKALKTNKFFSPNRIAIISGSNSKIEIYSKKVEEKLREMAVKRIHFSISHERHYAMAMVIFEGG